MKVLFFPVCSVLFALAFLSFQTPQPDPSMDYEREWNAIDSLENEGLYRSALERTEALYDFARSENNAPQQGRAMIYRAKYTAELEEDGAIRAINLFREVIETAESPLRPVLQSMLGELYMNYTQANYGRLSDRTEVPGELPTDVQTWTLEQFAAESARLYLASLQGQGIRKVPIDRYAAITTDPQNTEGLRTTLYDFLAHRALDHFSDERLYLTAPAYRFQIDQATAFAPAPDFVETEVITRDTASFKYRTLGIFRELLAFHLDEEDPAALVDADLKRLRFVHEQSVHDQKDSLYLDALQSLERRYREHSASAEVLFYLARYHYEQGQAYQPNPKDWLRWEFKKAKAYCDEAIRRFPESYGASHCQELLKDITREELALRTEVVNLPDQSILARLEYRNLERAHLRLIELSEEDRDALNRQRPADVMRDLSGRKALRRWSVKLPLTTDYQNHATEIRIGELPSGNYALLISAESDPVAKEAPSGYLFTQVSGLAYFYRRSDDGNETFLVTDRNTGEPLEDVLAEFFATEYTDRNEPRQRKIGQKFTDADGRVTPPVQDRTSYQVRFSREGDVLSMGEGYYSYSRDYRAQNRRETHFFLDRSIYRPGQTVYFKGLLLENTPQGVPSILSGEEVEITFYDVNNQEVAKQSFRSNRYGTFNGSFQAPAAGLRGGMRLQSSIGNSSQSFRVEEYKRPKFEVVLDTLSGSPSLGEEITVSGTAQAFAGSSVDDAQVVYRVVREVRFPWLPWWSRGGFNPFRSESMEIANGALQTAADGSFEFTFTAQPDRSVPRDRNPEFIFSVYVDATDITGETQSTQKDIRLGYLGLKIDLYLPERIDRGEPLSVELKTTNLDGGPAPATGAVRVHRLRTPEQVFIDRYWEKPDQVLLREREFRRYFPHLAYENEDEPRNWPKVEMHLEQPFNTAESNTLELPVSEWPVAHYVMIVKTEDQQGQVVEVTKYFSLFDSKEKTVPAGILSWQLLGSEKAEPGEEVSLYLATAADGLHVLVEKERRDDLEAVGWRTVKPWETVTHEVMETDRGNLLFHTTFVRYNRAFTQQHLLQVPWSQKELQITYETFRDKLRPGSEEEWRIRISGAQKEAVAAEMVAAMYDASLDQFVAHDWRFSPYPEMSSSRRSWSPRHFGESYLRRGDRGYRAPGEIPQRNYRSLNWYGYYSYGVAFRGGQFRTLEAAPMMAEPAELAMADTAAEGKSARREEAPPAPPPTEKPEKTPPPPLRTNLQETVFFFPELQTNAEGDVILKFTMNEALTRWKLLGFAHTTDLKYALTQREVVTQKELMVLPNPPRFLRTGDQIELTAKASNLTEQALAGKATLRLLDATNMQPVDDAFGNTAPEISFEAPGGQSDRLAWNLSIPEGETSLLVYQITVQSGDYSDGEQSSLPVLTNRMLVTETKPLPIRGGKRETFTFEALERMGSSASLEPHQFTLEFTSNPAWYAVKALPYLMEYPHDCIEQIFNRYYANTLASSIANKHPKVKEVFERWRQTEDALESPLALNQELKSVLLEETPWVLQAQSEAEQRKRIGLLFDLQRMAEEQAVALTQVAERQESNGGFSWFPGGRPNWYMTQYIVEGLGHLNALNVADLSENPTARRIGENALRFIDGQAAEYYQEIKARAEEGKTKLEDDHLSNLLIHFLYTRSFFPDRQMEADVNEAHQYFLRQAEKHWLDKGIYEQGLIALALRRAERQESARRILRSLEERALRDDELGMYWKYDRGYFWHQLPIETHALMIELFSEVGSDPEIVEELKIWLLKNKQTTHWQTTKATAAAVFALLRYGGDWLSADRPVEIDFPKMRNREVDEKIASAQATAEPGTGYFKTSWDGAEITVDMAKVRLRNPNETIAWGALYWQYFEDLDKIKTFEETPLTLQKQLYQQESSDTGPVLRRITAGDPLEPGDKVIVRIELRVDREMEYVHLKDMRASGFEPVNVLSNYKWQGGLGYYESTGDVATHFFIDYLPRGTYVFEYPLKVYHRGDFSNGISSIQCMYAPEFTSHSEGSRVQVK